MINDRADISGARPSPLILSCPSPRERFDENWDLDGQTVVPLYTWNTKRDNQHRRATQTKNRATKILGFEEMMSPHTLATLAAMLWSCNTCIAFQPPNLQYSKFSSPLALSSSRPSSTSRLHVSNGSPDAPKTIEEDAALQWDMFTRHHALDGEWWGTWSTYNYMGDLEDSTVAGLVACAIFIFAFVCTHLVVQVEEMHSS